MTPEEQLHQRAVSLRRLALRLQHLRVSELPLHTGTDTWIGPSPSACGDWARATRRTLRAHADQLKAAAQRLDSRTSA